MDIDDDDYIEPYVPIEEVIAITEENVINEDEEPPLEPRFKYERMRIEMAEDFLKRDIFTCLDLNDKFVALGSHSGRIYILDHYGYGDFQNIPVLKPHRSAVSKIKFDDSGSYVISCGNDSRVVISGIGSDKLACSISINIMPKSLFVAPNFAQPQSKHAFILGERSLTLYEKSIFKYSSKILYGGGERDGLINCCSWKNDYIAFTNDSGTQVIDKPTNSFITQITPSHDIDRVRSSRCPPRHLWLEDMSLVIAWADTVTIVKIVDSPEGKRGEVHYMLTVPMFLSGVSYTAESTPDSLELFLIGLQIESDEMDDGMSTVSTFTTLTAMENNLTTVMKTCVIRLLGLKEFELQSEDIINNVKLPQHSLPSNIHAAGIPSLNIYFIVTLKDIVTAVPYGPEDGVRWRLRYKMWEEAFDMAKHNVEALSRTEITFREVGRQVVEGYLKSNRARAAASRLPQVCGDSKEEWEWAVNLFENHRLCTLLADVLPQGTPQLEPECYESVLLAALFSNPKLFRKLTQTWSPDLYRSAYIINRTQWRIQETSKLGTAAEVEETEKVLMDALAHLYIYERKYENALKIFMSCHDSQIFNVIDKHQLFDMVKDQISELMEINSDRALRLLLDNEDCVPSSFVMDKIARQPKLQLAYLTKLMSRNEGAEFADKAVQLYADHDRKKLMQFLKKNENYHLNRALRICQARKYVEETIFLLAKSGNHYDAVNTMVKEYDNIDKSIDYCKDQNDPDLWIHLVEIVSSTPVHLAKLLIEASNCLNPLSIIQRMPTDVEIPGLKEALTKILSDFNSYVHLQEGCYQSTLDDTKQLITKFSSSASNAVSVHKTTRCAFCMELAVIHQNVETKFSGLRVFKCGHVFHLTCSEENEKRHHGLDDSECSACAELTD